MATTDYEEHVSLLLEEPTQQTPDSETEQENFDLEKTSCKSIPTGPVREGKSRCSLEHFLAFACIKLFASTALLSYCKFQLDY